MELQHILTPERTQCHAASTTKKSLLELTSKLLAKHHDNLHYTDILAKLVERERLGSTGIGHGVAIPHARMTAIDAPIATLLRLKEPVNFDSADDKPVDLVFAFIVPEGLAEEHLELISTLATLFNESEFRDKLRNSDTDESLYNLMVNQKQEVTHG